MSKIIRSLLVRMGVDYSGVEKDFKKVGRELKYQGYQLERAGANLTKGLTLPILGAGVAFAKLGMDWQDSVAKVSTIADTGAKSIETIKDEVMDLSDATGEASTEINEALYQAISATGDTKNAMLLVEAATKAAKGGFTDTTTAVNGLSTVLNSYNIGLEHSAEVANLFFVAQKKGKTTFGELASTIGRLAPMANNAGLSIEELLGSVTALTNSGLSTDEAMTAVRSALTNIISPTKEASEKAEQLGLDFSISALKAKGFAGFMEDIRVKTGGNSETMAKLFGNVRALNAVMSLTSEKGMAVLNETLAEMETNATALDDAFNEINDTASNQLRIGLNQLKNDGIELGEKLIPVLTDKIVPAMGKVSDKIGDVIDKFEDMSSFGRKFTLLGIGMATGLGPTLTVSGKLITTFGKVVNNIGKAQKAGGGFIKTLGAVLGPAGTATAVLIGLTAVVGTFAIVISEATKEQREYLEEGKQLVQSIEDNSAAFGAQRRELSLTNRLSRELVSELMSLQSQEKLSERQKLRLKDIVEKLNSTYDDLNLTIDESTGLLKDEKKAVEDLVEAKIEEAEKQLYEDEMIQARKDQITLTEELTEATKKLADYLGVPETEITKRYLEVRMAQAKLKDQILGMQFVMGDWIDKYDALQVVNENLTVATDNYSDSLGELTDTSKETSTNVELTNAQMNELVNTVVKGSYDIEDATELTKEAFEEMILGMEDGMNLSQEQLDLLYEKYGESFTAIKTQYENYYSELESRTQTHYDSMGGLMSEFSRNDAVTVTELTERNNEKVAALTEFGDGIETLADRVDENGERLVPDELLAELSELPLENVDTITELANSTDEELGNFVDSWQSGMDEAHNRAVDELKDIKPDVDEILGEINGAVESQTPIMASNGSILGSSLTDGLVNGMRSREGLVISEATRISRSAINAMRGVIRPGSPSKVTTALGKTVPDGLALGMKQRAYNAIHTAKEFTTDFIKTIQFATNGPQLALSGGYAAHADNSGSLVQSEERISEVHIHNHIHSAITDQNSIRALIKEQEKVLATLNLKKGKKS